MTRAEAAVAADDRGERAGEAAGVNVACRRGGRDKDDRFSLLECGERG
jgi:hypothetical protein